MIESTLLRDLSIVMVVAAVTTFVARLLKQPVVIGYLLAGLIIGPHTPPFALISDLHSIHTMAELGLVFLMFSLGLEFNLVKLKRVGASAALAAVLEILGMFGLGFALGKGFGWSRIDSIFLGAILSISSTTIIVKVFSDLKFLKEEFAQVVFGILILEDIVAVVILALLSGLASHQGAQGMAALRTFAGVGFFVILFLVIGLTLVPRLLRRIGRFHSPEMLGITALGLCLASALVAKHFGFSVALGAFLMGSIIGVSHEIDTVEEWIHPIRDMFSAIFFVSAGLLIEPQILWLYKGPILWITGVTIIGKILSGAAGAFLAGFRLPTSLRVGMSLAQIGEFSFVFASLGLKTKMAGEFLYPLAVTVSAITTLCTPYLIRSSDTVSGALLDLGGGRAARTLDKYHAWVGRLRSRPSEEAAIFSKYLIRLALYVVLYMASVSAAVLAARTLVGGRPAAQTLFWVAAAFFCLPFMMGIARYLNHFLLLAGTEAMVRLGASKILRVLPIFRLYQILEILTISALASLFFWQTWPSFTDVRVFMGMLGAALAAAWLSRPLIERLYRTVERLLDEAVGLASSEPLRRAALAVEGSGGALNESVARIWISTTAKSANQTVRSLGVREKTGASLIGVYRGGKLKVNPSPETVLLPNDVVVILGSKSEKEKARSLLE